MIGLLIVQTDNLVAISFEQTTIPSSTPTNARRLDGALNPLQWTGNKYAQFGLGVG
jgi:hypothetical protein